MLAKTLSSQWQSVRSAAKSGPTATQNFEVKMLAFYESTRRVKALGQCRPLPVLQNLSFKFTWFDLIKTMMQTVFFRRLRWNFDKTWRFWTIHLSPCLLLLT